MTQRARSVGLLVSVVLLGCAKVEPEAPGDAGGGDAAAVPADAAGSVSDASPSPDAFVPACPAAGDCGERECGEEPVCGLPCGRCPEQFDCVDGACACVPACDGRACGPDGCGGRCGECPAGDYCDGANCRPVPDQCPGGADCDGRTCGPDPVCGTDCGACPAGHRCEDGRCRCVPDCRGRVCGPDPVCGTDCGACDAGRVCEGGQCRCVPDCRGRACGDDGCGGTCGACGAGEQCEGGQCRCVPDCRGRACGDDGCGGTCGLCEPGRTCARGQCVCTGAACGEGCCGAGEICGGDRCCADRWRRAIGMDALAAVLHGPDGRVYAAGRAGGHARVASFDACGGEIANVRLDVAGEASSASAALAWTEGDLLVAGTLEGLPLGDPGQGFVARLAAPGLQARWLAQLTGSPSFDEVFDIEVAPGGTVWMSGSANAREEQRAWWGITADLAGRACGWNAGAERHGLGRGLALDVPGRRVYMTGMIDGALALRAFDLGCVSVVPPCGCDAVFQAAAPSLLGEGWAEGRRVLLRGDHVDVVGFEAPGDGDGVGRVVRFDLRSGRAARQFDWNPTRHMDLLTAAVATDDGGLLVGGIRGWPIGSPFTVGSAVVLRLSADLRLMEEHVVAPGAVAELVPVPGALYVGWSTDEGAGLARCRPNGECPP